VKILQKVLGGGYFFDSHCSHRIFYFSSCLRHNNITSVQNRLSISPVSVTIIHSTEWT